MRAALVAVAVGGVAGSLTRFGISTALPTPGGGFPWATWLINISGCLLIGVLMAWLSARRTPDWVRPLLGVGFLGGYTTFSAYTVDALTLVRTGHWVTALVYVFSTLVGALVAVYAGWRLTGKAVRT